MLGSAGLAKRPLYGGWGGVSGRGLLQEFSGALLCRSVWHSTGKQSRGVFSVSLGHNSRLVGPPCCKEPESICCRTLWTGGIAGRIRFIVLLWPASRMADAAFRLSAHVFVMLDLPAVTATPCVSCCGIRPTQPQGDAFSVYYYVMVLECGLEQQPGNPSPREQFKTTRPRDSLSVSVGAHSAQAAAGQHSLATARRCLRAALPLRPPHLFVDVAAEIVANQSGRGFPLGVF